MTSHIENTPTIVCFGEILWDLLPTGALPGGAPMNVAYHLHTLGLNPQLITRLGSDERGDELMSILHGLQVDTSHVQVDLAIPTGVVNATPDANGDMKYEFADLAAWDHITVIPSLLKLVEESAYFIYGSLVARREDSRAALIELLGHAKEKILDINLRAPHYTRDTLETLMEQADLLKMNEEELELISSWYGQAGDMQGQVNLVREKFGIRSVLVTRGANGAMVCYKDEWASHSGFKVQVADTVGSGDSFLAGFLYSVINGKGVQDALAFACQLGSFVATKKGAWPEYTMSSLQQDGAVL
ncbi:MAG: carbohydrate kinase [Chitinophagaceae bacterium]|nr:MAG: carbohydrate kinase [Chitinophagaceae bacterium]